MFHSPSNLIPLMSKAYTAHFDESGTHDESHRVLVVAGFVSTFEKWKRFEDEWAKILSGAGLPEKTIFHMKDFARNAGTYSHFEGQPEEKKNFISQLVKCTRRNVNKGFSCALVLRDWERVNESYSLKEELGFPYPFCGLMCIAMVHKWAQKNEISKPIEFFFEDGATHKGQLKTMAENSQGVTPMFLPKEKMMQFQCCDLAAWKHRKAIDRTVEIRGNRRIEDRDNILRSQQELYTIPSDHGVHDRRSLLQTCKDSAISKRMQ